MPKKTLYIITSTVLALVLLIGGWFLYSASKGGTPITDIAKILKKTSPFGEADPFGVQKVLNAVKNVIPGGDTTVSTSVENKNSDQLMFKLSDERSSGIGFADVLVPGTREVLKKILIDDPRVASSSKPKKIQVTATTTETFYATTTRIRYVEQGSGHIFEYNFASSTTRKLTNTTIPKTQEAYFLNNGSTVLLRYLDDTNKQIENYLANIPVSSVADKLDGVFLSNNITSISVSPSTSEFFYLAKTNTGSLGNIYNIKTNTERRVFDSPFSEWVPDWKGQNVFVTTKASSIFQGYIYGQSLLKNSFYRITGNKLGLTSLSNPDGSKILLGEGANLSILNVSSGETIPIVGLYSLPEKCTWSGLEKIYCFGEEERPLGSYPEDWYQGKVSFNDDLYSISAENGDIYKIATMEEMYLQKVSIDAINITIAKDEKSLIFLNKKDMSPWYINLDKMFSTLEEFVN